MHELGIMTGVIEAAEKAARDSGATRLLKVNLSIGEIAGQCGFTRESHLAFLFRKRFNMTMSAYRAAARNTQIAAMKRGTVATQLQGFINHAYKRPNAKPRGR